VRTVLRNLLRFLETFISTNWLARRTNLTVHGMHLPRLTKGPFFWKKKIGLISESVKQRGLIHASHSRPSRRFTLVSLPLVSCTKKCYLSSWKTKRFDEQTENFPTPNTLPKKRYLWTGHGFGSREECDQQSYELSIARCMLPCPCTRSGVDGPTGLFFSRARIITLAGPRKGLSRIDAPLDLLRCCSIQVKVRRQRCLSRCLE
jgi:hypothetical protein